MRIAKQNKIKKKMRTKKIAARLRPFASGRRRYTTAEASLGC